MEGEEKQNKTKQNETLQQHAYYWKTDDVFSELLAEINELQSTARQVRPVTTQHAPHLKPCVSPSFQSTVPIHTGGTQEHALSLF